jgi:GxxExxY protein
LAIEALRHSRPGSLKSFYAAALCRELERSAIRVRRKVGIPAIYQGDVLPLGFRADILVEETIILEIKAVPASPPVHECNCKPIYRLACV